MNSNALHSKILRSRSFLIFIGKGPILYRQWNIEYSYNSVRLTFILLTDYARELLIDNGKLQHCDS